MNEGCDKTLTVFVVVSLSDEHSEKPKFYSTVRLCWLVQIVLFQVSFKYDYQAKQCAI
jgi:hypothetical protein